MLRSDETAGTRQRRAPILLVLTLTAIGLVGSLLLVWSTIASERAERAQVERTNEIMIALRDIDRAAINAEAGQRGYFITLDKRYLATYEFGRALYPRSMDKVKAEVEAAGMLPRQKELLSLIEQRADTKFDELAKTVALTGNGDFVRQRWLTYAGPDDGEAGARAQGQVDLANETVVTAKGTLDALKYGHVLFAPGIVGLRGVGTTYDGEYYLKAVKHVISRGSYSQEFTLTREGVTSAKQKVKV